jgi:hypothetical protein
VYLPLYLRGPGPIVAVLALVVTVPIRGVLGCALRLTPLKPSLGIPPLPPCASLICQKFFF